MKKLIIKCNLVLFTILLPCVANAKEVLMAFSLDIPPYIFQKHNKGIEIDIIAAALAYKGHTLKPLYFPLGRVPIAFSNNVVDAAMGDMGIDLSSQGGFYADPAVIYDNVFITLKSRNISIKTEQDLDTLHVVSFQSADKRYPKWLSKVQREGRFYGITDQMTQVKLLHYGRYDVVLSDRYIFRYFVKEMSLMNVLEVHEVDEHSFISVNPEDYRPVFKDKNIRDDFNLGLSHLKKSGGFDKIYDKYMNL